jgi:flagellar biogenesis protein FliO
MRISLFFILVIHLIPALAQNSELPVNQLPSSIELLSQQINKDESPKAVPQLLSNESNSGKQSIETETTQAIPFRQDSVIPPENIIRVAIVLIFGLALAFLAIYLLKKYYFSSSLSGIDQKRIQLIEVKRVSPRLMLFMLEIDKKTIVLAQSGETLLELDPSKTQNIEDGAS